MWASPEQQAAAYGMKHLKLHKSAKPGKIQRHAAGRIRRNALRRLEILRQIKMLRSGQLFAVRRLDAAFEPTDLSHHPKAVSSAFGTLRATALQVAHNIICTLQAKLTALFGGSEPRRKSGATGGGCGSTSAFSSGPDPPDYVNAVICANNILTMKKALLPYIAMAGLALGATKAYGALMTSGEVSRSPTTSKFFSYENNDAGIYNSAGFDTIQGLSQDIYALGNHSYSSVDDMVNNSMLPQIRAPPDGDSFSGWSVTSTDNGYIQLTNPGILPDIVYTQWDNDADSSKMTFSSTIDNSLLEQNNQAGYQELTLASILDGSYTNKDATIVRSDSEILDYLVNPLTEAEKTATFTGVSQSGFTEWNATGENYVLVTADNVIPEPTTLSLIGLTDLGALLLKRRLKTF